MKKINGSHIVCFIASVITERRRLEYFKLLLDSIRKQSSQLDGLIISIYIDPILEVDWTHLFCGVKHLYVMRQKRPKRQFVQIDEMYKKWETCFPCPPEKEPFIMFSDDDDLWHKDRVYRYMDLWDRGSVSVPHPENISSMCMKEFTHVSIACKDHVNSSNVDAMIDCGCVEFQSPNSERECKNMLVEYHEYVVRPHVLGSFLEKHGWLVRNNRFADMEFRNFVHSFEPTKCMTLQVSPVHWLYYYRKSDPSYMCATNPVIVTEPLDIMQARDHEKISALLIYSEEMRECHAMELMAEKQFLYFANACTPKNMDPKIACVLIMSLLDMIRYKRSKLE